MAYLIKNVLRQQCEKIKFHLFNSSNIFLKFYFRLLKLKTVGYSREISFNQFSNYILSLDAI